MAKTKLSLVDRLRDLESKLGHEAADEILRLREELKDSYIESMQVDPRWVAKKDDEYGSW